jgi:hypothetical protein
MLQHSHTPFLRRIQAVRQASGAKTKVEVKGEPMSQLLLVGLLSIMVAVLLTMKHLPKREKRWKPDIHRVVS